MKDAEILAEFICRRIASKQKIVLGDKFWNDDYWGKQFKKTIIAAHSILKVYSLAVILAALKRPEAHWITSLRARQLHDLCRSVQRSHDEEKQRINEFTPPTTGNVSSLPPTKKSTTLIDKLK